MPWCPKCRIEYRDGFTRCDECGCKLVDELEPEMSNQDDLGNNDGALLMTAVNNVEADIIEAILKADGIPVLRKYKMAGGYLMVFMGGTIFGVDIYVPFQLLDKAREILRISRNASDDAAFPNNIDPNDTESDEGSADGEEEFMGSDEGSADGEGDFAGSDEGSADGEEEFMGSDEGSADGEGDFAGSDEETTDGKCDRR